MNLTLIVNPTASSLSRRSLVMTQKQLSAAHDLTVHETTRQHHATRLAHRAMKEGADAVITLGGDGTVNEAANGLLGTNCGLAPLPGGSTNVFSRAIGYPNELAAATKVLLRALDDPGQSFVSGSVGMANERAFVFHVGAGFDGAVVERVERRSPLKRLAGHPWFVASAVLAWSAPSSRQWHLNLTSDSGQEMSNVDMAVVMNVDPYTYLGNRAIAFAPEVNLGTPLSVVALDSLAIASLFPLAKSALSPETTGLSNAQGQHHWQGITGVTITADDPFPYQLDGEPAGPVTKLRLEHRPDAVRFIVPLN